MWGVAIILIAVASCNAKRYQINTADLPTTMPDDNLIIDGAPTTVAKYPFVVQVLNDFQYHCGGSVLTTNHILSAAHCFIDANGYAYRPRRFFILAGSSILHQGGSLHSVMAIKVHELYNSTTHDNNVAVALIGTPIDFTYSAARKATIPSQDAMFYYNTSVTSVGWGSTDDTNIPYSAVLTEVTVRKISPTLCRSKYRWLEIKTEKLYYVTSGMICTGILDVGGKSMCQSVGGGPLVYSGVVVGISSWGIGCARPEFPWIYTRVANYTNWIKNTINDAQLLNSIDNGPTSSNTGWLISKGGAITQLTSLLYLYAAFSCYESTD